MRLLWAFNIHPAPGAKLPLNPKDYVGDLPGIAGSQMPVTLTVISDERRRLIDAAYVYESRNHVPLVRPDANSTSISKMLILYQG